MLVIDEATLIENGGWLCTGCGTFKPTAEWIQTSYNVYGGEYKKGTTAQEKTTLKLSGTTKDVTARNRKNYAGIDFTYDKGIDAFIPPKPYPSWKLDKNTALWVAPKPYPTDGKDYVWDEKLLDWVIVN